MGLAPRPEAGKLVAARQRQHHEGAAWFWFCAASVCVANHARWRALAIAIVSLILTCGITCSLLSVTALHTGAHDRIRVYLSGWPVGSGGLCLYLYLCFVFVFVFVVGSHLVYFARLFVCFRCFVWCSSFGCLQYIVTPVRHARTVLTRLGPSVLACDSPCP
jgi:hypothetical protein